MQGQIQSMQGQMPGQMQGLQQGLAGGQMQGLVGGQGGLGGGLGGLGQVGQQQAGGSVRQYSAGQQPPLPPTPDQRAR